MREPAFTLDALDVQELDVITFAFAGRLDAGATIASAATTVTVENGTDANPTALLQAAAQISGSNVLQPVIGTLPGVTYKLRCRAVDSVGKVYVSAAILPVVRL